MPCSWTASSAPWRGRTGAISPLTVLFLDLDGFKAVNDALGHEGGDRLLEEVGRRLYLCVRSSDTVARLAGDEFVVLLEEIGDEGEAALAADRIKRELEAPFKIGRRELPLTASIGVAVGPPVGGGPGGLLRYADLAMYRAKENGKNR